MYAHAVRSDATTVDAYLAEMPADRRESIEVVREAILARLPDGYVEEMRWGMITYSVPLATYPDTYNGQPLMYAALANQKNHMAVYLTSVYSDEQSKDSFVAQYKATGKRLDMGKSCVRFRKLDDLPVDLIGDTIGQMDVDAFVELHVSIHG